MRRPLPGTVAATAFGDLARPLRERVRDAERGRQVLDRGAVRSAERPLEHRERPPGWPGASAGPPGRPTARPTGGRDGYGDACGRPDTPPPYRASSAFEDAAAVVVDHDHAQVGPGLAGPDREPGRVVQQGQVPDQRERHRAGMVGRMRERRARRRWRRSSTIPLAPRLAITRRSARGGRARTVTAPIVSSRTTAMHPAAARRPARGLPPVPTARPPARCRGTELQAALAATASARRQSASQLPGFRIGGRGRAVRCPGQPDLRRPRRSPPAAGRPTSPVLARSRRA